MAEQSWQLVHDAVMPFGPSGRTTVVHVRAFEHPIEPPVVIIGQFGDHEGLSLTNGMELAAASVQTALYPEGRPIRFVQHTPYEKLHHSPVPGFEEVTFARRQRIGAVRRWFGRRRHDRDSQVAIAATVVTIDGSTRHVHPTVGFDDVTWRFMGPGWHQTELRWSAEDADAVQSELGTPRLVRPSQVYLPDLLGDLAVQVWPTDLYVSALIGGLAAAQLAEQRTSAVRQRADAEMGFIGALTDHDSSAIVDVHSVSRNEPEHDER
ncbi:hypothetical protein [Pseudonocardia sp. GCM10023141]|uniref:hypothetical protein n=1 Tax=Pseudonocardia sp. GCM10023141 TaxID=3252653 RepID=UPI00361E27E9